MINLGQPGDDNLAVTSLDLRDPVVLAGRSVALEAGVRDFGHVARQHQAVDLLVDGRPAGRQYVDIPAGGSAVVRFNQRFESAGDHAVEVRLAGDPLKPGDVHGPADALEVDNHRYLAVNVRQAIRVLCVDGRPAGDPRQSSVFNLGLALSSRSDPNRRSPIEFDVAPETAVLERDLGRYDCVMLSNVAQFTASEARVLDNYLIHGGSLVFFLGDRVIADNYNSVLAGRAAEGSRQILPARLIAVAKNPGRTPRSAGLPASDRAEIPRPGKDGLASNRPSTNTSKSNCWKRSPASKAGPLPRPDTAVAGQGRGRNAPAGRALCRRKSCWP